ncbi:hypothetical protein ACLIMP_04600 [Novosphingobium aerophilum]|uniref:hypothetical protein n=1 Tax=Novosphingobium TaxID=165696 RepID=UPI002D784B5B|nr:hypothetical protein [Novosphingobium sp. RL4]WRT93518.1 hypothetical protein U9J33_03135 [Novosphingobium sp. RL4]
MWWEIAKEVVTALAEREASRQQNQWMGDVINKLDQINGKLDLLLDEVRLIREEISRLPNKFDEIMKDVEESRAMGARSGVLEILSTAQETELSPAMLEGLAEYLIVLSGQEGLLENKWGYSSAWTILTSFLTRAAGYKILAAYNPAWAVQLKTSRNRKLAFFDAGLATDEASSGPGRALLTRTLERAAIEDLVRPCLGTTVQICWWKGRITQPELYSGNNYAWTVVTQPSISGGFERGYVWMDVESERQPEILTADERKPSFPGKTYSPVGAPEIIPTGGGEALKEMIYEKRRILEADMNSKINRHSAINETITHLTPIVSGLKESRDIISKV